MTCVLFVYDRPDSLADLGEDARQAIFAEQCLRRRAHPAWVNSGLTAARIELSCLAFNPKLNFPW